MAPPFVLDYLAAHEVAHLRELNHSRRFWRLCRGDVRRRPQRRAPGSPHNGPALHAIGAEELAAEQALEEAAPSRLRLPVAAADAGGRRRMPLIVPAAVGVGDLVAGRRPRIERRRRCRPAATTDRPAVLAVQRRRRRSAKFAGSRKR